MWNTIIGFKNALYFLYSLEKVVRILNDLILRTHFLACSLYISAQVDGV